MKLYTFAPAANALRVEMFLREKELKLETISVNVREDELFKEPYNSMNPFNCIPFEFSQSYQSSIASDVILASWSSEATAAGLLATSLL